MTLGPSAHASSCVAHALVLEDLAIDNPSSLDVSIGSRRWQFRSAYETALVILPNHPWLRECGHTVQLATLSRK